jgi:hypothetical protein
MARPGHLSAEVRNCRFLRPNPLCVKQWCQMVRAGLSKLAVRGGVAAAAGLLAACAPGAPQPGGAALSGEVRRDGLAGVLAAPSGGTAAGPRRQVELRVLVLSAGDVGTQMIARGLDEAGVPFTAVDLDREERPEIREGFLCECGPLVRRARFQAIVAPNEAPSQLSAAEREALADYQREFGVRRVDGYVFPSPGLGFGVASAGPLDGVKARLTSDALAGAFGYLRGAVQFDDADPAVPESYGYVAVPEVTGDPERSFTALVEAPLPGGGGYGALIGILRDAGREEMLMFLAMNASQLHQQALFPGILNWLTYGVHLGTERNYLTVQIDDVLSSDARWIPEHDCTRGNDCPSGVTAPDIVMSADDVAFCAGWQVNHGFGLDLVFNGGAYDARIEDEGSYPAGDALLAMRARFINHTYTHEYLGCVRDLTRVGFPCSSDATGGVTWAPFELADGEIARNVGFARAHAVAIDASELVTGEHSGLQRAPDEPSDNPNFVDALRQNRIAWLASDASREPASRVVGSARTVPRYPMNLFFNTGRRDELVDEFNWIHVAAERGGSGLCARNPLATCLEPLEVASGFDGWIVPREVRTTLRHALSNDPRPHYAHQTNLAEERLLYPVLEGVLGWYADVFGEDAPLVHLSLAEAGAELRDQAEWRAHQQDVVASTEGRLLRVAVASSARLRVPVTVPAGTRVAEGDTALRAYAGQPTGWRDVSPMLGWSVELPESVGYAR